MLNYKRSKSTNKVIYEVYEKTNNRYVIANDICGFKRSTYSYRLDELG